MTEPTYSTGEPIQVGDVVEFSGEEGQIEQIVTVRTEQWEQYWRDTTGEGVMIVGLPRFGRLFSAFADEDFDKVIFLRRGTLKGESV